MQARQTHDVSMLKVNERSAWRNIPVDFKGILTRDFDYKNRRSDSTYCKPATDGQILGRYSREKFKFGKNVVKLILYIYKLEALF